MVWEVRTELNTELFQALTFFWGSLAFHSSYLSASNSSRRTQWRPQLLGHVVPGMYVLPHPAQRNRASSGQPQGTCSVPLPPPYKEYPRIGLYLASHSSFWCHLPLIAAQLFIQKGHCSTNFADWGLPAVSFRHFLKSDHSFHWPLLERLIYARPCVRLWGFGDRVLPSGNSLQPPTVAFRETQDVTVLLSVGDGRAKEMGVYYIPPPSPAPSAKSSGRHLG